MTQESPLRFKVRCPHCQQVFVVNAPTPPPTPAGEMEKKMEAQHTAQDRPAWPDLPPPPPPPEPEPIEMTPEEEEFREKIVDMILSRKFDLPMLPHVALKVIRLTGAANVNMQDLAKVILTDQTIATKIIQISNSPVYAGTMEIKNINQALVRLGQTEIKNLMLAISLQTKIFKSKMYGKLAKRLWERSVGVAFASRMIASTLKTDKDEAFLCGLMHNLGKMITVAIVEGAQRQMEEEFHASPELIVNIMDQYHTDVGQLTVEKWTLPQSVGQTISYFHRLHEYDDKDKVVPIVALGETFCEAAGIGIDSSKEIQLANQRSARMLETTPESVMQMYERFLQVFDNAKGEFM